MKDYQKPELELVKYDVEDCLSSPEDSGVAKDPVDIDFSGMGFIS